MGYLSKFFLISKTIFKTLLEKIDFFLLDALEREETSRERKKKKKSCVSLSYVHKLRS